MTLIEVLASLVILGTVLVAIVLAKGRFTHQSHASKEQLIAVKAANKLLNQWWSKPKQLKKVLASPASGNLSNGMRWRTEFLPSPNLSGLHARQVRLEILSSVLSNSPGNAPGSARGGKPSDNGQILTQVDFVAPLHNHRPK